MSLKPIRKRGKVRFLDPVKEKNRTLNEAIQQKGVYSYRLETGKDVDCKCVDSLEEYYDWLRQKYLLFQRDQTRLAESREKGGLTL